MKDNLKDFIQIKNSTSTSADLYFYGDIVSSWIGAWDDTDQYPDAIKNFLDEHKGKDLNIYINSNGGSVFSGLAIYCMLSRHKAHKTVYVDGLAASISSIIALSGDEIIIPSNAYMMVHEPWCGAVGNSGELRKQADLLDSINETILNIYQEHLCEGVNIEDIRQMMKDETWLNGNECSKYFNVKVSNEVNAVACVSNLYDKYNKVPEKIVNKQKEEKPVINLDFYKSKIKMYEM